MLDPTVLVDQTKTTSLPRKDLIEPHVIVMSVRESPGCSGCQYAVSEPDSPCHILSLLILSAAG